MGSGLPATVLYGVELDIDFSELELDCDSL
jgi:hypothetical protein